jgi:hypothetical protein
MGVIKLSNMPITKILPDLEGEANDTPKNFTNIDKDEFVFSWDGIEYKVKPGETKSLPKYLVNYAAMHLARKIIKREAFDKFKNDKEKSNSMMTFRNEAKEKELQDQIVKANYEGEGTGKKEE